MEQEATLPGIKLLYVCISFLASPAGTPKPPGAICSCCFISHSNQRGQKEPANKDPTNRLSERSCQVRQSRGHLQDFLFSSSSSSSSSSSWPHAEIKGEYALFSRVHRVPVGERFIYQVLNYNISVLEENIVVRTVFCERSLVSFIVSDHENNSNPVISLTRGYCDNLVTSDLVFAQNLHVLNNEQ